jgi:subtilisin family serine protease
MQWFHWRPAPGSAQARPGRFGHTAVIGLRAMRDAEALRAEYGLGHVEAIPALRAIIVHVDELHVRPLLATGAFDSRIRYVSRAGSQHRSTSSSNDPLVATTDAWTGLPYEWQFAVAGVDRALRLSAGDPRIVVGTIDTGAADIPDLAGKVDGHWSFAPRRPLTPRFVAGGNDDRGHGTAVASLIAANVDDGFGMAGFGGATHVIAFNAAPEGVFDDTRTAIALTKLVSLGARIVNMSFGDRYPPAPILVDAIHKAAAAGVLLVASTGNEHGYVSWPAAALQPSEGGRSFGLAVGASDFDGAPAAFSNFGSALSLVAPGNYSGTCSGVLVALPPTIAYDHAHCNAPWSGAGGARYAYLAGTSVAAPEVAGVAALIWAARPELRNYEVADIIKQSARRRAGMGWTPAAGCGVLDAGAALELATSRRVPTPSVGDPRGACGAEGGGPATWPQQANQTITFTPLRDVTMGAPDFAVRAQASSHLPVSFRASGNCTLRGGMVHAAAVGVCAITASQPGNAAYNLARPVSRSFSILAAGAAPERAKRSR